MKNNFGAPKWVLLVRFFCHFLKVASLVFLDIARDCSLVECLTSSRAKTLKKKKIGVQIWAEMIFSILVSLSVHANLLLSFEFSPFKWTKLSKIF